MQGHYDDQIGGAVGYAANDMMGSGGGPGGPSAAGGAAGAGGGPSTAAGGVNGGAAINSMRIEGDAKDVTASQNTNNAHNMQFGIAQQQQMMKQQQQHQAEIISYRDQDLSKCKIHRNEDIKAFCKNCLCSICFKCLLGEHRNHEVVMLDELQVNDLKDKVG